MGRSTETFRGNGNDLQTHAGEGAPFSDQERYGIASLRELDLDSEQDMTVYFKLLTHPLNREHFSSPPTDPDNLKYKLTRDGTRAYLAENMLGETVGAGGINDAAAGEHDHFLVKVVVDPQFQGKGLGKQLVVNLIEKAFSTKTGDGRDRTKLDAAIIREVPGWDRMPHLLATLGFHPVSILVDQVDVVVAGRTIRKPTERWEITRGDWMRIKRRQEISLLLLPK